MALFFDNARMHRARSVQALANSPEIDIELIWNCPYRPDLNGIEKVWLKAKRLYKARVDNLKAQNRPWEQIELVR